MAEKKRKSLLKEYDLLDIQTFLIKVKTIIDSPKFARQSFAELTKYHKLGQGGSLYALKQSRLVRVYGRGFKNWGWTGGKEINFKMVELFINKLREYNKTLKGNNTCRDKSDIEIKADAEKLISELLTVAKRAKYLLDRIADIIVRSEKKVQGK